MPPSPAVADAGAAAKPAYYSYEVVKTWPHDRAAYTQGLLVHGGSFLESTGLNGQSSLREVDIKTGRVLKQLSLPAEFFGEGLAVLNGRAFQLTWRNHRGFVYNADTFRREGEFTYEGEGWGLTTDGRELIMSDGTNRIRFLDPTTFKTTRTIDVLSEGKPVERLNELEWIKGEIFANVWLTNRVVRIDPVTGRVLGEIDFVGLLAASERRPDTEMLNGIAYDAAADRLFITGKRWPAIFEVKLKVRP